MREQMIELIETDSDFLDAVFEDKKPKSKKEKKPTRESWRPYLDRPSKTRNGTINVNWGSGQKLQKNIRSYGFEITILYFAFKVLTILYYTITYGP